MNSSGNEDQSEVSVGGQSALSDALSGSSNVSLSAQKFQGFIKGSQKNLIVSMTYIIMLNKLKKCMKCRRFGFIL